MQRINAEGRARAIGVSNFPIDRLVDLAVQNEVTPAVNQVETHPFRQQHEAQQQMAELGVQIESWGPFAEGKNGLFTNATLLKIAEEHGRTVGQVVLRWLTQRGVIAIPKSVRPERMAENLASQDFNLTDTDMAEMRPSTRARPSSSTTTTPSGCARSAPAASASAPATTSPANHHQSREGITQ
jgi:2,5-diketo-D-gluconate reductase A